MRPSVAVVGGMITGGLLAACTVRTPDVVYRDTSTPVPDETPTVGIDCQDLFRCVADAVPSAAGDAIDDYGASSDCWANPAQAVVCETACRAAREEIVRLSPEVEACQHPQDRSDTFVGDDWSTWYLTPLGVGCGETPAGRLELRGGDTWDVEVDLERGDVTGSLNTSLELDAPRRSMGLRGFAFVFDPGFRSLTVDITVSSGEDDEVCSMSAVRR